MTLPTIDCRRFDDLLSDYLENTVSLPLRAAMDGHAASCARCSALLADVRAIVDRAGSLPELEPSRDLWPGIAAQLDTPVVAIAKAPSVRRLRIPRWVAVAAAAAVLIVVTSLVTRQWVTGGDQASPVAVLPNVQSVQPAESLGPAVSPISTSPASASTAGRERVSAAVTYGREIVRLEAFVRHRGDALDPATKAIIENSMRIIDSALVEARAALARDPASRFLSDQVDQTLEKKMELLRTVTLLAART